MVNTGNKNLVDRLKKINDHVQVAHDPKIVIRYIVEFVGTYHLEDVLKAFVKELVAIGREENAPLRELENKAGKDIDAAIKKITVYISTTEMMKSATSGIIKDELADLKNEKSALESYQWPIETRYYGLCNILLLLAIDSGDTTTHHEFIKQFTSDTEVDNGILRIRSFDFSPNFAEWRVATQRMQRVCKTSTWYFWDRIAWIYFVHQNYEQVVNKYDSAMFNDYFTELKSIMLGRNTNPSVNFDIPEIKYCVQKIFDLTSECLSIEPSDVVPERVFKWYYDHEAGMFWANNLPAKFIKNKNAAAVLRVITENKETITEQWWFDDLYEKVIGCGPEEEEQIAMYYACKQINKVIQQKTGLASFLIFSTTEVRVNPDHID